MSLDDLLLDADVDDAAEAAIAAAIATVDEPTASATAREQAAELLRIGVDGLKERLRAARRKPHPPATVRRGVTPFPRRSVVRSPSAVRQEPSAAQRGERLDPPGNWYLVHSYAGYEGKVRANLETRVKNLDASGDVFQVELPIADFREVSKEHPDGITVRKQMPGMILVRMRLNDKSLDVVRGTPGVTGIGGDPGQPRELALDTVVNLLPTDADSDAESTPKRRARAGGDVSEDA
ncbi:transcription termination/antitermination NusG family protein [Mycolicibacterium peregrinum]|uniref:transcription termination/antitermination NusG family protein n=1 Tax=Mycolicibacterium peregrinum TaxID=43304 RepID=UPI0009ED2ABB|nr:transcription termination/antitermination NusG family protein [Mycolicibacterium peregrinum]